MEEKQIPAEERLPNEVVEVYRRRNTREVVEVYTRPLPGAEKAATVPPAQRKKSKKGLWIFLSLLAVAIGVAVVTVVLREWHVRSEVPEFEFSHQLPEDEQAINIPTYPFGKGGELNVTRQRGRIMEPQAIYGRVNPAVVTVMAEMEDEEMVSVGTGVIFSDEGYLLTNYHVVEGGQDCLVMLDTGYTYPARYVAGDRDSDLAVLKCDEVGLPVAVFGDSDQLIVGDPVYAIGNPLGVELRGTFTNGIVSAVDREVEIDGRYMTLIQTNAALNSGNSGGPLIDQYGRVVGINVIKMTGGGEESATVEGLGFAIPTADAERIVNDLLTYGAVQPEPQLGISVLQVAEEVSEGVWGVKVVEVVPDSAADRAGVQADDVVLFAGGMQTHTSQDVLRARRQYHIGDRMDMTIWRDGETMDVVLDLQDPFE